MEANNPGWSDTTAQFDDMPLGGGLSDGTQGLGALGNSAAFPMADGAGRMSQRQRDLLALYLERLEDERRNDERVHAIVREALEEGRANRRVDELLKEKR